LIMGALRCRFLGPGLLWSHGAVRTGCGRLQEKEARRRRRRTV
jgi:hypothetical protein